MRGSDRAFAVIPFILIWALLFTGCSLSNESVKLAQEGWERVGGNATRGFEGFGSAILICKYSSRSSLNPGADTEYTSIDRDIPSSGTAILYCTDKSGFDELYAVFYNSSGVLSETFSYSEWDELYDYYYSYGSISAAYAKELAKALICISNCNYVSSMYNHARSVAEDDGNVPGTLETNQWYEFSDKQKKTVAGGFSSSGINQDSIFAFDFIHMIGGTTFMVVSLIVTAVYFVIQYFVAKKFEQIAIDKGYSPAIEHPFAMCFWLGIAGMIYVLALPDKTLKYRQEELIKAIKSAPVQKAAEEKTETKTDFTNEELPEL